MTTLLRHTAIPLLLAGAISTGPVLAQNAPPAAQDAAPAATARIGAAAAPADPRARQRKKEQQLLGAPNEYGAAGAQGADTDNAQQAALLDEQRMQVMGGAQGGARAPAKGQRNVAPVANAANAQAGGVTAAGALTQAGAAKTTYADPFDANGTGKHAVYKSPW